MKVFFKIQIHLLLLFATSCDVQNPVIGKLASQIKASKLTNAEITNHILMKGEIAKLESRLCELKKSINFDDDDDGDRGNGGGGGGSRDPIRAPPIAIPVPADGRLPPFAPQSDRSRRRPRDFSPLPSTELNN